ncbi:hypothetical protein [Chitinilyticum piscinae]|uniref:hypothetical protein n=1 Tax=Chitinilyticum piscinae TaxID=2866724 RepID=UPI001D168A04|nr:hypothetical protein [Chitinilyticum piscinae]
MNVFGGAKMMTALLDLVKKRDYSLPADRQSPSRDFQAQALVASILMAIVIADKGFDSYQFVRWLEEQSIQVVTLPRRIASRRTPVIL